MPPSVVSDPPSPVCRAEWFDEIAEQSDDPDVDVSFGVWSPSLPRTRDAPLRRIPSPVAPPSLGPR